MCRHRLRAPLALQRVPHGPITVAQAARLGADACRRRSPTGEVVSVGTRTSTTSATSSTSWPGGSGALVSTVAVTALLLGVSVPLGLTVLIGVPVLMAVVAVLLRPLHRRDPRIPRRDGALTNRAGDIVAGLRVLRGIGGEAAFGDRYRVHSQEVRVAGVRVARLDSTLQGAAGAAAGHLRDARDVDGGAVRARRPDQPRRPGGLLRYATFLVFPLRTLTEAAIKITSGLVAARRVVRITAVDHRHRRPARPRAAGTDLDPDRCLIGRRFTAYRGSGSRRRGGDRRPARPVRRRAGPGRRGGAGRSCRRPVRSRTWWPTTTAVSARGTGIGAGRGHAASAEDILDAADESIVERGREFSGGQQQRLRLVRALRADPPVLVLVEPTSAVDAHTEARIAARSARTAAAGRRSRAPPARSCSTGPTTSSTSSAARRRRRAASRPARHLARYRATVTRGEA